MGQVLWMPLVGTVTLVSRALRNIFACGYGGGKSGGEERFLASAMGDVSVFPSFEDARGCQRTDFAGTSMGGGATLMVASGNGVVHGAI